MANLARMQWVVAAAAAAAMAAALTSSVSSAPDPASSPPKKGFVADIETLTEDNNDFRRVLYTGKHLQLVLMSLRPGEEIGAEVHPAVDQFFRIEEGEGEVHIDGVAKRVRGSDAFIVPAGATHNVVNKGDGPLKLYTIYAPPEHRDGIVRATKADAQASEEHFDGKTTE